MCIIIVSPKGAKISKNSLKNSWHSNPDGAGYMFERDGQIIIKKELKKFKKFLAMLKEDREENPNKNFIIHFRIGTSGGKTLENLHPFRVNDNLAFAHNGIISKHEVKGSSMNDTRHFKREVLQPLENGQKGVIFTPHIKKLIESYIGYSKLAFLTDKGDFNIFNEHLGHWGACGNWYSNESYMDNKPTYGKKYNSFIWDWEDESEKIECCYQCNLELIGNE